jgi:hypothetical protein
VSSHGKLVENVSSENSYDTKKSSKGDFWTKKAQICAQYD